MIVPATAVLFLGSVFAQTQNPPPLDCTQLPNGVHRWGCKAYEACSNGQIEYVECLGNEAYDQNSQRCVVREQAAPPCNIIRDCSDEMGRFGVRRYAEKEFGAYPCQYYYTCIYGRFMSFHECSPGTVYDEDTQQCMWRHRVPQPCGDLQPGQDPDAPRQPWQQANQGQGFFPNFNNNNNNNNQFGQQPPQAPPQQPGFGPGFQGFN